VLPLLIKITNSDQNFDHNNCSFFAVVRVHA
jgi:hypothetical protein